MSATHSSGGFPGPAAIVAKTGRWLTAIGILFIVLGLLAIIEIFRSEMEFAREHGGEELLSQLKEHGHYPYSDLDRDPVA